MADKIRFYFDQHVPIAVAQGLQRRGIDVLTAQAANTCGEPDLMHLERATQERRVIVTFDDDFLTIVASGVRHCGLVFCHAKKYSVGELIRALLLVYEVLDLDEMKDHIEFL
jgi:predicted nuclease of predicted toxin-antitoxin system